MNFKNLEIHIEMLKTGLEGKPHAKVEICLTAERGHTSKV